MKRIVLFLILSILLLGCVEDFNLKLKDAEPRLVVEGLITNKPGPYYVRLTKSIPGGVSSNTNLSYSTDNAEPVVDATVIITDDLNNADTLKAYKSADSKEIYYNQGFYETTKLKGIPGHTYHLWVIDEGNEYTASAYMSIVPEIDSIGYVKKISEKDGQEFYVPLISFKEPQGIDNYYLIQLKEDFYSRIYSSRQEWKFSILSDTYLNPYVSNLNISTGANPRSFQYWSYKEGDSIYVALNSLTKEAYNYYKVLLDQFENDGGAYKPTPSSPPTNISNGGLGLFRASAVSEKRTKIPSTNVNIWFMN
ncbi:MAG TPA: hypothetical protein DCL77_12575 [Prolixibacteraceae bacterium]|jgi:hypothetical protein|nr:hypothetical protein [Prolixibacteraceae bacterium]